MKKARLLGVELCRGIATYAVILVHSGDQSWGLPITSSAINFRLLFYFAVPFFLAAAFFFMASKASEVYSVKFWKPKIERILIPYALWSSIYFVSRTAIFTFSHKPDRLKLLLEDPLSVVFFGGASYQLYFLPLLFTGTFLALSLPLLWRLKNIWVGILIFLSIFAYEALIASNNDFQLGETSTAFSSLLQSLSIDIERYPTARFSAVQISWLIKCSPYFLTAFLFKKLELSTKLTRAKPRTLWFLVVLFALSDTVGRQYLPHAISELLLAFSLLALGFVLSSRLNSTGSKFDSFYRSISSAGACSFGIYLLHPFTMNFVKPVVGKILPSLADSVSIYSMTLISIPCFLVSWLAVFYLSKNHFLGKYLFGT